MKTSFDCARISGIASTVPANKKSLSDFASLWGEREVANIIAATGISEVRVADPAMTTADLCFAAATRLLPELDISPELLDGIVFVSQTPDHVMPATSALLHGRLGCRKDAVTFDLNYGCSGYIYGLLQCQMLIHAGLCRRVLLCCGDVISPLIAPRDRSTRMVFGDAGSATLVEKGADKTHFNLCSDGSGARFLIVPAGGARLPKSESSGVEKECEEGNFRSLDHLFMDGMQVMAFALREVPPAVFAVMEQAGWTREEVGLYGLHQANRFMLEYLRKKMKLAPEAVPFSCGEIGNTGPASLPVMLAVESDRLRKGNRLNKVVLCGFGVGLSWAAVAADLSLARILPLGELSLP